MQGQTRRLNSAIGAGASLSNILAGLPIQYPARPSVLQIAATVPAAATGDILMTVKSAGLVLAEDVLVPIESAAGRGPDANLGWIVADVVGTGLIEVTFRNQDAANATTITTLVSLQPA